MIFNSNKDDCPRESKFYKHPLEGKIFFTISLIKLKIFSEMAKRIKLIEDPKFLHIRLRKLTP